MSFAPSPSPGQGEADLCEDGSPDHVALIAGLVVVGVLALFLVHVLGALRRRSSHKLLHAVVSGAYALSYTLVSYTLGLMQSSGYYVDEFPVWALCLLLLLGSTDSPAHGVQPQPHQELLHEAPRQGVYIIVSIIYLLPKDSKSGYLEVPLWAILFVILLQSYA